MEAWFGTGDIAGGWSAAPQNMFIRLRSEKQLIQLWNKIWWKFMTAEVITLLWPIGTTEPDSNGETHESADPNDHWRPWLEANIGRQHFDWEWDVNAKDLDMVEIRVRRGKRDFAIQAKLRWG